MNQVADNLIIENRPGLPGLFFWQILVPAFVFGILSIKWMLPSLTALLVYFFIINIFRPEKGAAVLLLILFGFGNWYGSFVLPPGPGPMEEWMTAREKVQLSGIIHSIKGAPGNRLKILLEDVTCQSETGYTSLSGYLNWTWDKPDKFPFVGQSVSLYVRVKPVHGFRNSGLWDYDFYCRIKNIRYRTYTRGVIKNGGLVPYEPQGLQKLRASLREHILKNGPPTDGGAIFPALLTGDRFYLSRNSVELIRRAGVSHILALSGLHVGFIVAMGFGLAWLAGAVSPRIYLRVPRMRLGVLFSVLPVLLYLWLGQFSPSLMRAVCMFGFWGLLMFCSRGRVLLDGLFLAVVVILAFSPLSVFDLGFQLSVLAVSGIALLYPLFARLMPSGHNLFIKMTRFVLAIFYVSLSANIALLPITIWNFGVLTPNFIFNILFVPVLGSVILPVCGVGGLVASYFSPELSQALFMWGAKVFDWLLQLVREAVSAGLLPEYAFYRPHWEGLLIYYLVLGAALLCWHGKIKRAQLLLIPIVMLFGLRVSGEFGPDRVRMDILDTGQSQCVVISGPAGTRTVVDGGGGFGRTFDMGRSIVGPWLAYGHLPRVDNVFMTHGDRDHAGGLAFLFEKFAVGSFYSNGDIPSGRVGERFVAAFKEKDIVPQVLRGGDEVVLEPGLVMQILHPSSRFEGSRNDRSLYLRLLWNGHPLLSISGDLDSKGVRAVLKSGNELDSKVLILPHHGSAGSYSPELYERVAPEFVLAACGFLNRFNFVSKKVVRELDKRQICMYTTSAYGILTVEWNNAGEVVTAP
ncbi:DNA internalization-related competence protein ComEC/Rec2 [Desulfovibrio sp. JC022]|uniref:DNA internalization-related competence protein ComEC/Rec2 n=1 Tax=Desulfovibrio sp. JC022 TaxID=2593642 RepID=UPI0013D7E79D|nr:DNA internalization-related competence protein ComEC/Rec2 [Desulfovibrio sp. JC022]NDV24820.1 DNA internalization-related competence protein ComEC/Rec2 [Desulfovibrio sp. JC022]